MSNDITKKKKKVFTPLQRMLKALAFLKPDRVPVLFFPEFDLMADFAGIRVKEYLIDVDLQVETGEKFKERFSEAYCAVSIYQPYAVAEALGCKLMEPEDLIPSVIVRAIEKPNEIEKFKIPDSVWDVPGTGDWLKKIEYSLESGIKPAGTGEFGPVEIAALVFGYDKLMFNMVKNPELIHKLLEKTTEFVIKFQKEWIKLIGGYTSLVLIADHTSGFLNKKLVDEFFAPYHKRVCDELKPLTGAMFYHSENRSSHFLHEIGNWGYSMFHGQEWGEHRKAKETVSNLENKFTLVGQIPGRDVMLTEPDDKVVEQKIIENIQIYGPGSGYILSTGGGVNRGTPFKRLDLMIELTKKYGMYQTKKKLFDPNEIIE
ncbi:MAG: uroporphyrinogen decarboxylase family protein [Promethearchaeota archaeon]